VIIANQVTNEGESTWYEGLQLLAVYLVLALAFSSHAVGKATRHRRYREAVLTARSSGGPAVCRPGACAAEGGEAARHMAEAAKARCLRALSQRG